MNLHDRLKQEREKLGFSQTAFAALARASKHAQINWEKGAATPNADALLAWTAAGADIEYILHGVRSDEKALIVMGVQARLVSLGFAPDARPEAVMAFLEAHPDIDAAWLYSGQGQAHSGAMSAKEKILISNYRAASGEGKKALEVQAAFFAQNNTAAPTAPVSQLESVRRKKAA